MLKPKTESTHFLFSANAICTQLKLQIGRMEQTDCLTCMGGCPCHIPTRPPAFTACQKFPIANRSFGRNANHARNKNMTISAKKLLQISLEH